MSEEKHYVVLGEKSYPVRITGNVREIQMNGAWHTPDKFVDSLAHWEMYDELAELALYGLSVKGAHV